jgi:hypothetical protein
MWKIKTNRIHKMEMEHKQMGQVEEKLVKRPTNY